MLAQRRSVHIGDHYPIYAMRLPKLQRSVRQPKRVKADFRTFNERSSARTRTQRRQKLVRVAVAGTKAPGGVVARGHRHVDFQPHPAGHRAYKSIICSACQPGSQARPPRHSPGTPNLNSAHSRHRAVPRGASLGNAGASALRLQRNNPSVFPDVDRYTVHARGSAGVPRRPAQGAPDLRSKLGFSLSGSLVLHPLVSSN
jgi:hypothetical protein